MFHGELQAKAKVLGVKAVCSSPPKFIAEQASRKTLLTQDYN